MKAKHTPGPWLIAEGDGTFVYALNGQGFNRFDIKVQGQKAPLDEMAANARLIAAAPDMLAACELAERFINPHCDPENMDSREAVRVLREAIRKAKGEMK